MGAPLPAPDQASAIKPGRVTRTATVYFTSSRIRLVQLEGEPMTPENVAYLHQLVAGPALHEYARAAEIIDRKGPKLDAATEIGDKAVDAYHAGGSQGLLDYVRTLRGIGLAIARGEPDPTRDAPLSQNLGQSDDGAGSDSDGGE